VPHTGDADPAAEAQRRLLGGGYEWRADDASPTFFPGRHAAVLFRGQRVGEFGIIHPEVLAAFDIVNPGGWGWGPGWGVRPKQGCPHSMPLATRFSAPLSSLLAGAVAALELELEPFCFDQLGRQLDTQIL
jgi:phenylalanyl-tRNA synthetase beta chain